MTTAAVPDCEMAATPLLPNPKKAKLDRNSVKKILDETVCEIMESKGEAKDDERKSVYKLLEGTFFFALAFFGPFLLQLLFEEVPNKIVIIVYIIVYSSLRAGRKLPGYFMERDVFLFTYPFKESRFTTGLALSSTLAGSADLYTLTMDSADPESLSPPLSLTRSISEWFTGDGVLIEELFKKDVVGLLKEYSEECHKFDSRRYWRNVLLELSVTFAMLGICMWIYVY